MMILLITLLIPLVKATLEDPEITFERLYKFGKDAYTAEQWTDCVGFMRRALEDYEYYQSETISCAVRCAKNLPEPKLQDQATMDYVKMARVHHYSQSGLCIKRCRRERFTPRRPVLSRRDVVHDFMERKPYNYLQLCYWKDGDYENAAKAAYTYLVANPTDEEARENMAFYMDHATFTEDLLEDKMRADYERMFISGVMAYEEEDWTRCISHLDTVVEEFLKEDAKCRIECRFLVDWNGIGSDDDIDTIIASIYKSVVSCQYDCLNRLSWVNGHSFGNLLAQVYRYQHMCYYKQMRGQDAARAISNHLILDASPDMRWNKAHYQELYPGRVDIFRPEAKIVEYAKKRVLEQRYLDFIENKFKIVNDMAYPSEHKNDYVLLDDVSADDITKDEFPYEKVSEILSPELCKELRKSALQLPSSYEQQAIDEATSSIQLLFPFTRLQGLWCGPLRRPSCDRAVVLSIEAESCSKWLGNMHEGCAIVACE